MDTCVCRFFAYNHSNLIGLVLSETSPNGLAFSNLSEDVNGFGVDARLDMTLNPSVDVVLGWAFQTQDGDAAQSERAPAHQPYVEINVDLLRSWSANVTYSPIVGRERSEGDERLEIDDYHLVNMVVRKKDFFKGLDLLLKVDNLFDSDAREDISSAIPNDVPVSPRAFYFGIKGEY